MPELPEIETVRMQLERVLPGRRVINVEVLSRKVLQGNEKTVLGLVVVGVRRKAKVLIVDFENDISMMFHFKMTGQLVFIPHPNPLSDLTPTPLLNSGEGNYRDEIIQRIVGGHPTEDFVGKLPSSHTRIIFELDEGIMYFNDQRLFGWVKIGKREELEKEKFLESLGPEPLDIDEKEFVGRVSKSKKPIKLVLMDQTVISGVGNIYANDGCWEAGVDPKRPANTLTAKQYSDLYLGTVRVLQEGIKYGGATAADAKYINLHGLGGHYQEHFRTYDREGEECKRNDGGIIHKFTLGGRGTYMCSKCQL